MTIEVWLAVAAWLTVGAVSHVYWVTNQYDYTSDYIATTVLSAVCGPIALLVDWLVYGDHPKSPRILFRKRRK